MADFKVQRGTITMLAGTTTVNLVPNVDYTPPSSDNKAFIRLVGVNHVGSGSSIGDVSGIPSRNMAYFSGSELTFGVALIRRDGTNEIVTYEWEIVESLNEGANSFVVLGAGTLNVPSTDTTIVSMPVTPTNSSDVAVFITGQTIGGGSRNSLGCTMYTASFDSMTGEATFTRGTNTDGTARFGYLSYAIVEFTGVNWSVERVTHQRIATTGTQTATITDVGDLSRAFIHTQQRNDRQQGGSPEYGCEIYLSSPTEITYKVDACANTRDFVTWIIRNSQTGVGAMNVQRRSGTRATNVGADPDIFTDTITAVPSLDTTSLFGITANNGAVVLDMHLGMLAFKLTATDTVTMTRGRDLNTRLWRYEAVTWPEAPFSGPTNAQKMNYRRICGISSY